MRKFYYILFCMAFLSCSQKEPQKPGAGEIYSPEIDLKRNDSVSILDFCESTDVVQLETSDSCLIQRIVKIMFDDNRYYVFDRDQSIIFCFDSQGKFLFKIDRKGQGPGEYIMLGGFDIDHDNRQLLLVEPFGHLLTFDLEGKFISKIRLPKIPPAYNEVYALDKVLFVSLTENQLIYYSRGQNKTVSTYNLGYMDIKRTFRLTSISDRIYKYNETP